MVIAMAVLKEKMAKSFRYESEPQAYGSSNSISEGAGDQEYVLLTSPAPPEIALPDFHSLYNTKSDIDHSIKFKQTRNIYYYDSKIDSERIS